ncbi:hypothetical protein BYT27DRAFT_7206894 [Phlegmacium glaucopus]|nr:hypothetical protein BYT27DRAFT_7206894 [Phlegmacium glaucopus]
MLLLLCLWLLSPSQYLGLAEDSYKEAISPMTHFSEDLKELRKKHLKTIVYSQSSFSSINVYPGHPSCWGEVPPPQRHPTEEAHHKKPQFARDGCGAAATIVTTPALSPTSLEAPTPRVKMKISLKDFVPRTRVKSWQNEVFPDFDIVFVVLHRGDSKWMKRQKNTSNDDWSFAMGRFTDNLRTILIHGIQDTNILSVQKTPVDSGYSIGK